MLLTVRSLVLLLGYFTIAVLPLALGLIDLDPGRGFWINFSVARCLGRDLFSAQHALHTVDGLF